MFFILFFPAPSTVSFSTHVPAAAQKPEPVAGYCLQGACGGRFMLSFPAARPQAERRTLRRFLSLYAASPQRQCLLQASVTLPKKEQPFAALFYPEIKRIPRSLFLDIPFINPYNKHREFPCNIKSQQAGVQQHSKPCYPVPRHPQAIPSGTLRSSIIIHSLGNECNDILTREGF